MDVPMYNLYTTIYLEKLLLLNYAYRRIRFSILYDFVLYTISVFYNSSGCFNRIVGTVRPMHRIITGSGGAVRG